MLDKSSCDKVGMFFYDIIWFANIYKVTIPHLVSGRTKSAFIIVYLFSNSVEVFCIIPAALKSQLLSFSLGCVENCAVQYLWCHPEFQCTLQFSLHSICNTWKRRFPFSDSTMIWQTVSKMLKAQSWLLYGKGMRRQMATVLCAAIFHTARTGLWGMSWPQTDFSFKGQLLNHLACFTIEVCGNTCSQEAVTQWKDKYLGNFISATLRIPQSCSVLNCNIFQHLLLVGQLMSPVLRLVSCDSKIVFLRIFLLRTWIFSELTLLWVPIKGGIMENIVWTINLLEGLGKRVRREGHSWAVKGSLPWNKAGQVSPTAPSEHNKTHGMVPGVSNEFVGHWAIKNANCSYLLVLMSDQTRTDFDFAFFSRTFRCSVLLLLWAEKSQKMAV